MWQTTEYKLWKWRHTPRMTIILMDMPMPQMDGLEATRQIRQIPGREAVPIIAMTANAFCEYQASCQQAAMSDVLSKPVMSDLLYTTLLKALSA